MFFKSNMKTNLVIAFYFGEKIGDKKRNSGNLPFDDKHYIEKQIACLTKYNHHLAQITFVIATPPTDCTDYSCLVPKKIKETLVSVLQRENSGLSYGSYKHAINMYKEQFDYYIFIEDDYMFVHDNFDKILIDGINNSTGCDYFTTFVSSDQWISLGIIKTVTLKKYNWLNHINFEGTADINECKWLGTFMSNGKTLKSFNDSKYVSPFYTRQGVILFMTNDKTRQDQVILIAPNEMVSVDANVVLPEKIYKVTNKNDILLFFQSYYGCS